MINDTNRVSPILLSYIADKKGKKKEVAKISFCLSTFEKWKKRLNDFIFWGDEL